MCFEEKLFKKYSWHLSDFLGDAWKVLLDTAGTVIQDIDQEAIVSLTKFVDQLPSVMNQVW